MGARSKAARASVAIAAAHSTPAHAAAGFKAEAMTLFVTSSAVAVWTTIVEAPPEVRWIAAATAGTVAGATASALAYPNLSGGQRVARVVVSFLAGLLLAPYAAAQLPRPDAVPLVAHVFSVSGACSFVAWSLIRAAQRRLADMSERVLDRITPRQNKDKDP